MDSILALPVVGVFAGRGVVVGELSASALLKLSMISRRWGERRRTVNSMSATRSPIGIDLSKASAAGRDGDWRTAPNEAGNWALKPRGSLSVRLESRAVVTSCTRSGGRLGASCFSSTALSISALNGARAAG